MADAGMPGFEHRTALGLVARAGTPSGAIDRLSAALRRALDAPETIARFEANGLEPAADASPATLAARIRDDRVLYGRIVKQLPIATE
jgi:tripartite-type tricarboxylate transporter receptor subunit TctC